MNVASDPASGQAGHQKPTRFVGYILLKFLGIAIFFATENAIAGAALPALYAGWKSYCTAWWILRSDYDLSRARICSAFCVATGFWQAAASAMGSVFVFMFAAKVLGAAPNIDEFMGTMIILMIGVAGTTMIGLAAMTAARIAGVRVWVHPRLREIVDHRIDAVAELPPLRWFNFAVFVMATSTSVPAIALSCFLLFDPNSGLFAAIVFFAGPLVAIVCYCWFASRIIAASPAECWE